MVTSAKEIGIPVAGPVVNMPAAGNANALAVFTIPALLGVLVGTKTAIIKKILLNNRGTGANTKVHFGVGAPGAVVDVLPPLDSINNLNDAYSVENGDFPDNVEVAANLMAYPDVVGASSIDAQVEVLVRG